MADFLGISQNGVNYNVKDETARAALEDKVDKITGKGLSTNDYSDTEKGKVADNAEAIEAMVNVTGSKNVAANNFVTDTIYGITFTVNNDKSVTLTGTKDTPSRWINFKSSVLFTLYAGVTYVLTSGLPNPETSGVYMLLEDENGTDLQSTYHDAAATYTPANDMRCKIQLVVHGEYQPTSGETIYPMIRDARIADDTYVPYAMTNRELTERMATITGIYDTGGVGIQTIPYPPGFTKDNCIAILLSSDSLGKRYAIATTQTNVALDNSNIQIYNENTSFKGYSFTVTLIKI